LTKAGPPPAVSGSPRPSQSQTDSLPGGTSVPPTGWNAALLAQIEQQLTRYLGPMARVTVKRGAKTTTELGALYSLLAEDLGSAQDRKEFLAGKDRLEGVPPAKAKSASDKQAGGAHAAGNRPGHAPARCVPGADRPDRGEEGRKRTHAYSTPVFLVTRKRGFARSTIHAVGTIFFVSL
jgi:hypothetical protein